MRHRLPCVALALTAATFLATPGLARAPDPPVRRLVGGPASSAVWALPERAPAALPIRIRTEDERDHTVLGLIVGGGLGFAAGWGFYNVICEAVDNRCDNSRLPYLVVGTGVGAGLGALIGSVVD